MKLLSNSIKTNSLWGLVKHHLLQILKSHTWQQWMLTGEHYCLIHQFLHFMSSSTVPSAFILPGTFFLLNFDENQFIHHCLGIQLSLLQTASLCPQNEWPEPLPKAPPTGQFLQVSLSLRIPLNDSLVYQRSIFNLLQLTDSPICGKGPGIFPPLIALHMELPMKP